MSNLNLGEGVSLHIKNEGNAKGVREPFLSFDKDIGKHFLPFLKRGNLKPRGQPLRERRRDFLKKFPSEGEDDQFSLEEGSKDSFTQKVKGSQRGEKKRRFEGNNPRNRGENLPAQKKGFNRGRGKPS